MNKTHRIVWSTVRQAYVVAHEHAASQGKPASTRITAVLAASLLATTPALADCVNLAGTNQVTLGTGDCARLEASQTQDVSDAPAVRAIPSQTISSLTNAGAIRGDRMVE